MGYFGSRLESRTELRVTGALPAAFLNRCARQGVAFGEAVCEDGCTLRLTVRSGELERVRRIARRCGCETEVLRRRGAREDLRALRRRRALSLGAALAALLLLWSSLYVWDIRVAENDSAVPDREILNVLDGIGVGVGSFWPAFTSDMIRSRALSELPELCWLTVNVSGSRAEVIARAAVPVPELEGDRACADVTAARSGIITKLLVLEGQPLAAVGDTVLEGETLVSATRTSELSDPRAVRARAEVTARTWYELTAFAPVAAEKKTAAGPKSVRLALILGKKRINFYAGSGISPADCDKITRIRPFAIEGVFSLPVALVTETRRQYTVTESPRDLTALRAALEASLTARLEGMLGEEGSVVSLRFSSAVAGEKLTVTLRAECTERIDSRETADTKEPAEEKAAWRESSR